MTATAVRAACPACGGPPGDAEMVGRLATTRGDHPWARCGRCRSYFRDEPYDLKGEVAHTRTRPWGRVEAGLALNGFKQRMFRAVLDLVTDHRPPPARLLDVGCSFGGFAVAAADAGYDVHAMDITPEAVDHVRSLGLAAERCSTPTDLVSVSDDSVDVVTCLDCNTLWADQPAQLAAVATKLRPGGLLVMRVVDKSWMFGLGRAVGRISAGAGERVMREAVNDSRFAMPVHRLVELLDGHGFEVVEISVGAAVHSDQTRWPARLSFAVGRVLRPVTRRNLAPGAVLVARLSHTP